jgi:hypothetical protein
MRFVRLGDVARVVRGKSFNQLNVGCRNEEILLPVGSILVSTNTTSGDFVVTDVPVALGDDLMAIIIESPDIDANYIRLFLRSKTHGFVSNGMVEVADRRNAVKLTADINVPLPFLDEQRRVVLLLEKADAICQKYRAALDLADHFLHSTSLDMFGDSVTDLKKWHTSSMAVQNRYSQIRNKMMIIKDKLSCELVQSNLLFNNLAASAFTPVDAA